MTVQPVDSPEFGGQVCANGRSRWTVARLATLSADLPVMDVPLEHMNVAYDLPGMTLRELAGQVLAVQNADLSFPIILDADGGVMDGRHRLVRAIAEGVETVRAVRFAVTPEPCWFDDE